MTFRLFSICGWIEIVFGLKNSTVRLLYPCAKLNSFTWKAGQIVMNLPLIFSAYARVVYFLLHLVAECTNHIPTRKVIQCFQNMAFRFERRLYTRKTWTDLFVVWHRFDYNSMRLENLWVFARLSHFWVFFLFCLFFFSRLQFVSSICCVVKVLSISSAHQKSRFDKTHETNKNCSSFIFVDRVRESSRTYDDTKCFKLHLIFQANSLWNSFNPNRSKRLEKAFTPT